MNSCSSVRISSLRKPIRLFVGPIVIACFTLTPESVSATSKVSFFIMSSILRLSSTSSSPHTLILILVVKLMCLSLQRRARVKKMFRLMFACTLLIAQGCRRWRIIGNWLQKETLIWLPGGARSCRRAGRRPGCRRKSRSPVPGVLHGEHPEPEH